jgi:hypothetical protein
MRPTHCYYLGLDLGQAQDFTALAVLERPNVGTCDPPHLRRPAYALRHLHRFPLGTPYPQVVAEVRRLLLTPPLPGAHLAVDLTGVGGAVFRVLADGLMNQVVSTLWPLTITAGLGVSLAEGGGLLVAKKELVGALQVLLQGRRLQMARTLPDVPLLVQELENFKAKVTAARGEAELDWRERPHDDLVLAVAMAAWLGELGLPPLHTPPEEPAYTLVRTW